MDSHFINELGKQICSLEWVQTLAAPKTKKLDLPALGQSFFLLF